MIMQKEFCFDLLHLTFHFYPASGFALMFRRIDSIDACHGKMIWYSTFFVINVFGFGFGVSNYGNQIRINT